MNLRLLFPFLFFVGLSIPQILVAQHEHHHMQSDSMKMDMKHDSVNQHSMEMPTMSYAFSRNLPMNRNGSGTGWMPDATTMYGHGVHTEKWMFMFMANIFARYNKQDITNKGNRGGEKIDVPNWLMFMGQRNIGRRGLFQFNTMFSLDPFSIGSEGYPLLFQSGETYGGKKLVDRQHPHDLFSGLSVGYTHMVSKDIDLTGYIGYPGEPALGPVAFMHRNSSLNNPDAPLSHHWQDATHISFGVATFGIRYKMVKAEVSSFTGREPDENRYNFDKPRFDSYSFRLLCNPTKQLALQISQAYLKSPEAAEPGINIIRTTVSIIHHLPFNEVNKYLATSIVYGLNNSNHKENSILIETNLQLDKTAIYGRYEWIQKGADELDITQFNNSHKAVFTIQALTLGISRVIFRKFGNNAALGVQGSIFFPDSRLINLYGINPLSGEVYLRLYPHLMHMHKG